MVKALVFKGDKKTKKRKRAAAADEDRNISSKALQSTTDNVDQTEDDNWVSADTTSDIAGPVLLVFARTKPVACLSVDQLGRVFAQEVENLIEGEPASAEPHDVRQVWIASRIAGMEKNFTFKGHHGRYLASSKIGELSAAREAVSIEETFQIVEFANESGSATRAFSLRTLKGNFVKADTDSSPSTVRADADEADDRSRVYIRIQARFKPQHKVEKAEKTRAKISRKELEDEVGRRLDDEEVKRLKKARREGNYHETMLDVKVKGKHDKYA